MCGCRSEDYSHFVILKIPEFLQTTYRPATRGQTNSKRKIVTRIEQTIEISQRPHARRYQEALRVTSQKESERNNPSQRPTSTKNQIVHENDVAGDCIVNSVFIQIRYVYCSDWETGGPRTPVGQPSDSAPIHRLSRTWHKGVNWTSTHHPLNKAKMCLIVFDINHSRERNWVKYKQGACKKMHGCSWEYAHL